MADFLIGAKVFGVAALKREMVKFGPKVERRASKLTLRQTAVSLRRHFRSRAPKGLTGNLRKSIKLRTSRRHAQAWVGLRQRFYYKTLEYGRKPHARASGRVRGTGPMNPWFIAAWREVEATTRKRLIEGYRKALVEEARIEAQRSRRRIAQAAARGVFR